MVQRPNIVRGIPMLLVRAMPTILYYGRYSGLQPKKDVKSYFEQYVHYLAQAIELMGQAMEDPSLSGTAEQAHQLKMIATNQIESALFQLSRTLSGIFSTKKELTREKYESPGGAKEQLARLFCSSVSRPRIAVVDTNNELEWVEKLCLTLRESCLYEAHKTYSNSEHYTDDILGSDFILFASAAPQHIHEDVQALKNYQRPGLVLGQLTKNEKVDQQTIRNGAWLRGRGYDVIFKLFSPLRLFTSIDKIYVRFLAQR
ncbi:MAG: hypothetical protein ONB31_02700 [candidate division KSB1 bacterium]|nr:hypothetical protein [candidate division KSB1 bacterium]MDZ7333965.1 hypothetical protein [candidate division KSB1 bacterium]MDZ7356761.1 hypothetical protein [candidate division KSB1 bacterium]MDZ7399950.1 hypothetical protein [candidate division KSB1 bacterium]